MSGYLVAGMDATVNALSSLLSLFARRPDLWQDLKEHPELALGAFEEIVRLESPIQGFFRVTAADVNYGDVLLPAGSRVLLSLGSANRDPASFRTRTPSTCAAILSTTSDSAALLGSLIARVEGFEPAPAELNPSAGRPWLRQQGSLW